MHLILGIALVLTLFGSAPAAAFSHLPSRVECLTAFGYDTNLLNGSDEELEAFRTKDPKAFFVVDRLEDFFFQGEIEADWKLGCEHIAFSFQITESVSLLDLVSAVHICICYIRHGKQDQELILLLSMRNLGLPSKLYISARSMIQAPKVFR